MDQPGEPAGLDFADYHGKFKLAWDNDYLYVLVEIIDDYLNPTLENGLENYWKGDYVELFIDEDKSGGNHKFNHQAFAYHVSTEGHAIDKSINEKTIFLDDNINVERIQEGHTYSWEMAIKLFDKTFDDNSTSNKPVKIINQKTDQQLKTQNQTTLELKPILLKIVLNDSIQSTTYCI